MLPLGIDLAPTAYEAANGSAAHAAADIDATLKAAREAFAKVAG
jgi:glutamate-1-semialdehyde 2,1-aminomutase